MYRANLTPSKLNFFKNLQNHKKFGADFYAFGKTRGIYREKYNGLNLQRLYATKNGEINPFIAKKLYTEQFIKSNRNANKCKHLISAAIFKEEMDGNFRIPENASVEKCPSLKAKYFQPKLSLAEIDSLKKIFPFPLNILYNVFNTVRNELGDCYGLREVFSQKNVSSGITHWDCTYLIKWPTEAEFSMVSDTKRSAASLCALQVLHYLKSTGKLDQNNKPLFEIEPELDPRDLRRKILKSKIKRTQPEKTVALGNDLTLNKQAQPVLVDNYLNSLLSQDDLRNKLSEKRSNEIFNQQEDKGAEILIGSTHNYNLRSRKLKPVVNNNVDDNKDSFLTSTLQNFSKLYIENQRSFSQNSVSVNEVKSSINSSVNEHNTQYLTADEMIALYKLFPCRTTVIHNLYDTVSKMYNNPDFDIKPFFSHNKNNVLNQWQCLYHLRWPSDLTFIDLGQSQKNASEKCAVQILKYLNDNGFLTKDILSKTKIIAEKLPAVLGTHSVPNNTDEISTSIKSVNKKVSKKKVISSKVLDHFSKKTLLSDEYQIKLLSKQLLSSRAFSTSTQNEADEHQEVLTKADLKKLLKIFPNPKNVLNGVFDVVSKELNNPNFKLNPLYTQKKLGKRFQEWECTYHLKWPADVKFTDVAHTKQEASTNAALQVLNYLKLQGKLTKQLAPILYDSQEVAKQKLKKLTLHPEAANAMRCIVDSYKEGFVPLLVNSLREEGEDLSREDFTEDWPRFNEPRRRFKEQSFYDCKESVKLPISDFKSDIMNIVRDNRVVVVKGEPGCGKSTRVPQYILESWAKKERLLKEDCRIIVTQPRRIAAISLAERVANERKEMVGSTIGYQVRLKSNFNNKSGHVLYCTTGILLRRLQSDPQLQDCTHVIIDEAHERDVNTDLLLNLLRQAVERNPNLKLIIMSATIDAEKFRDYFDSAAMIHIPGFTYPVKENFLKEENNLSKTLEMCQGDNPDVVCEDVVKLIRFIHSKRSEGAILCFLPGWNEILKVSKMFETSSNDLAVYCLHSRMQDSEQWRIFSKPPPGVRKVILATNIAETSVTIDDVVYVIDTGIQKEKRFDVEKGISCIDNRWISKSSMTQRKGRAGRVQSGESFHLYPREKFDTFDDYSTPEILRTSLTKIVLDSKAYSNNASATEFLSQLLNPPETSAILKAVDELIELELLDENENLTPLGRVISEFQLEPNLGKVMVNSVLFKCVTPIVDIVTLFSSEMELFAGGLMLKKEINKLKREFSKSSDHLSMMRIFEKWLEYMDMESSWMAQHFCKENNLIDYKLHTIRQLRGIHFEYLNKGLLDVLPKSDDLSDNDELVKAVLLSGVGHLLQHRDFNIVKGRLKKSNVLLTRNNHKATISSDSVNFKRSSFPTSFLVYINETRSNIRRSTTVRETSLISPLSVFLFKNNKIIIEEVPEKYLDENINKDNYALMKLENTNIECICEKTQAELVKECKESLNSIMQYYIYQLTKGGEYNGDVNSKWDDILKRLDKVLMLQGIDNR